MSNWTIVDKRRLVSPEGIEVALTAPLEKIVEFGDTLIVVLDEPSAHNVIALDIHGTQLWRIGVHPWSSRNTPYTGAWRKGDLLRLYNMDGFALMVDPRSGNIISREQAH